MGEAQAVDTTRTQRRARGVSRREMQSTIDVVIADIAALRVEVASLKTRVTGAALGGVLLAELARVLLERFG